MKVTIKEIAELAGVSRGTVDRVLHNRAGVSSEVSIRVKEIADKQGYIPDLAAKALASKRYQARKIGVFLCSKGNPFFKEIIRGIEDCFKELEKLGIHGELVETKGFDVQDALGAIDQLVESGIHGLVLTPINAEEVICKLQELKRKNIEVVAINTDILPSCRMAYIGCDYIRSGRVAAGLLGMLTQQREESVALIVGSWLMFAQFQRVKGFCDVLDTDYQNLKVECIVENKDDEEISYQVVKQLLCESPSLQNICFLAAGVEGGIRALKEAGKDQVIKVVTYDMTDIVKENLKNNIISATVCQDPYQQGYMGVDYMGKFLLAGKYPEQTRLYTNLYIETKYSICT